jgi:hypothetical protein
MVAITGLTASSFRFSFCIFLSSNALSGRISATTEILFKDIGRKGWESKVIRDTAPLFSVKNKIALILPSGTNRL